MGADDEVKPSALERLADTTAAAAGGLLGYELGGPLGAVLGSTAPPAVKLAWHLGNQALVGRLTRGSRSLDIAAAQLDVDLDELASRATSDPARLELLARVLEAAGRTPLEQKIPALGQVLALGIGHEDRVDEALILAHALDGLETPHVQVMQQLAGDGYRPATPDSGNTGGQTTAVIRSALPAQADTIEAVLNALTGLGVTEDVSTPHTRPTLDTLFTAGTTRTPPRWRLTDLGRRCLDLLRDQAGH
jgi:hypothetical protein